MSQTGSTFELRLGGGDAFHTTANKIVELRQIGLPDSETIVVLWDELYEGGLREPYYAISLDGTTVETVHATSYEFLLRHGGFDPAVETPIVWESWIASSDCTAPGFQWTSEKTCANRCMAPPNGEN